MTVVPFFRQVDLEDHKLELAVRFIPYAVDIARRTDKGIPWPGRSIDRVDRKDCLSSENIENFGLFFVIMQTCRVWAGIVTTWSRCPFSSKSSREKMTLFL